MALRHLCSNNALGCKKLPKDLKNVVNDFKPCTFCSKEITNKGTRHETHQNYCPKNPNRKAEKCPLVFKSCTKCNKLLLEKGLPNHEKYCGNQKPEQKLCHTLPEVPTICI